MANLNQPKGFDKAQIDGKLLTQLEPFVDYVNSNFDQIIRGFFNQLTLAENVNGKVLSLSLRHREPSTFTPSKPVTGVIPLLCQAGSAIRSFSFTVNQNGSITLTVIFDNPIPISVRSITFSSPYCTAETNASVEVGDSVRIANTANQNNSGDFLVIGKLTSPNRVVYYNANGVSESKSDYKGSSEAARSCSFYLLF